VSARRGDRLAMAGIGLVAVVVCWPLLAHINNVPPPEAELGTDLLKYYSTAAAARTTVFRFGQFPLRSPWHGGGYPLYAYPEDMILSPTMLLVLAVGPFAALKIEFVLLCVLGGVGMYVLTRRQMGYPLVAALFSATAFAVGGYMMTKWLLGWFATMHLVWLPWMMYALWRGRGRRRWLALAAVLVAWMLVDHKYAAMSMGWFLLMVGLLRLDEEEPTGVGPAWGYFGRLAVVWAFGAGLAAVKLVPMWPLLRAHLRRTPPDPWAGLWWQPMAVWLVIFAALGLMPVLGRFLRHRRMRPTGGLGILGMLTAVLLAVTLWSPGRYFRRDQGARWIAEALDDTVRFGTWVKIKSSEDTPMNYDRFRARAPVGPLVCVLAVAAVGLRPRRTWKWAILAGLLIVCELGPALPRNLTGSWNRLPVLAWIHRPREHLNFYLFFALTLLAGRGLDWPERLRRPFALRGIAWVLLGANVLFLGWNVRTRLAYSVGKRPPPAREWGEYQLLDEPESVWRDNPCFLIRSNIGLKTWDIDFRDTRHTALVPSLRVAGEGAYQPHPDFTDMAWFERQDNQVKGWTFTPNEIKVQVNLRAPGVLVINQIADGDWRPSEGTLLPGAPLVAMSLSRVGEYDVRLRYVPSLLYVGLLFSALAVLAGCVLLAFPGRDKRGHRRVAHSR